MKILLLSILLLVYGAGYSQYIQKPDNHHHHTHDHEEDEDDDDGCLPITLTEFTTITKTNVIKVIWSTETETDNDYFSIYHSSNGYEYFKIATVQGAGTTHLPRNYEFIDNNPYDGYNYYVLVQTDYNGNRDQYPPICTFFIKPNHDFIWYHYNFLGQRIN